MESNKEAKETREERAFALQKPLLDEVEISLLLQSHQEAKAKDSQAKDEKKTTKKLRVQHCKPVL
jgi:hypothetical protein